MKMPRLRATSLHLKYSANRIMHCCTLLIPHLQSEGSPETWCLLVVCRLLIPGLKFCTVATFMLDKSSVCFLYRKFLNSSFVREWKQVFIQICATKHRVGLAANKLSRFWERH